MCRTLLVYLANWQTILRVKRIALLDKGLGSRNQEQLIGGVSIQLYTPWLVRPFWCALLMNCPVVDCKSPVFIATGTELKLTKFSKKITFQTVMCFSTEHLMIYTA